MRKGLLVCAVLFCTFNAFASLQELATALDETIREVELRKITARLAETLSVEVAIVETALVSKKLRLSDVALAKFVAGKTEAKVESVLGNGVDDWAAALKKHNVAETEAEEYLDEMQTEVALMMLDFREVKKK